MKCHYQVLGVERDAGADDLKKSYRKLALKWHPDKNPDNVEECTSQFRLVQQAYDVLSDPQERAWYDKHREAILKGGLGHGDNYEDDSMDVFQYFNSSCYSGFDDDENGFYCVYLDVFKKLSEEDYHFMDDRESDCDFPEFGNSKSSYEEVVKPFYDFWESFQTAKSFVWVEKYDTREAPDRRCRRLMEAENKKLRDAAKKERNEQIRALVKFIKKRDKRVQAYKKFLEERNEEIKRKAKDNRERQIQERLKKMENYKETDWSAMTELEDDLQKLEKSLSHQFGEAHAEDELGDEGGQGGEEEEEEEEYYDDFFCVACNKAFKSDKAFSNHERSKKHKENLAFLRQQMHEEDGELAEMLEGLDIGEDPGTEPKEEEEDTKQKLSKKQKKKRKQQKRATFEDDDEDEEDELSKAVNGLVCEEETESTTEDTRKEKDKKKWKKKSNEEKEKSLETEETETTVGNGTYDNTDKEAGIAGATSSNGDVDGESEQLSVENVAQLTGDIAATHNSQSDNPSENIRNEKPAQIFKCNVCSNVFPTRNKMFDHIKKEGHAIRLDAPLQETTKRDKKNKRKGKR
ncbi:dnaJ homolog subfamily C member 21-like [Pecten maximus]|uniref:dnaJ homolog subfamily C member 21-like n=1 Tax=Pecten maximus TaxID=6579 RepID=UPI00145871A1|nr:dnaJ homolog subfamily C member 21-like [Pecten maximus]XP_033738208.1 dnaJ homolog subfamily C member 21-like [Pecten maximus]